MKGYESDLHSLSCMQENQTAYFSRNVKPVWISSVYGHTTINHVTQTEHFGFKCEINRMCTLKKVTTSSENPVFD